MKKNNYQKIAKDVIQKEIDGLKKLKLYIGNSFDQIIKTIMNCKNGKIIVSGVGKSGIIGRKWAGTFSSTGTPSFFMDASNASHGDMGQINSNDIVILISLSGTSEELKNIIQYCSRNKNIKLIGITSNKKSLLYKNSDIKVFIPNVKEAIILLRSALVLAILPFKAITSCCSFKYLILLKPPISTRLDNLFRIFSLIWSTSNCALIFSSIAAF